AALLWTGIEYLRSVIPFGGFPWGRLAFATLDSPLDSYARWVGVAAVSGVVFALAALVAYAIEKHRMRTTVVVAAVAAAVLAVGALLPTGLATPQERIQVAVVQGGVPGTGA